MHSLKAYMPYNIMIYSLVITTVIEEKEHTKGTKNKIASLTTCKLTAKRNI